MSDSFSPSSSAASPSSDVGLSPSELNLISVIDPPITPETTKNPGERRKKRGRTSTVSIACESCRQKHYKCDGVQPICGRCTANNDDCIWDTKRRKRGPKRKEAQTIEIQHADQDAVNTYILLEYLRQYNDHFFSIVMVASPMRDPAELSLLATDKVDGHLQVLMNTILGIGSIVAGDAPRSEELLGRARRMLGEYFDESSAFICASHCLFSYLQSENGNLEKAFFYNRTAVSSLEALILKNKGRDQVDGINIVYLYLSALLHDVDFAPIDNLEVILMYIQRQVALLSARNEIYNCLLSFVQLFGIWHAAISNCQSEQGIIEFQHAIQVGLESMPAILRLRASFRNRADRFVKSALSILYGRLGILDRAEHFADEVVNYVKVLGTPYYDTNSICDLFQAAQVHMRFSVPKYIEDISLLEDMSRFHPLGSCALRRLQKLKQQWDLSSDHPGACVVAPYAWSTAMELTNESDNIIVPFDAGQDLTAMRANPRLEFSTIFPDLVAPLPTNIEVAPPSQSFTDLGVYQVADIELEPALSLIASLSDSDV
eukprot:TRINITY_DN6607_c0_g1_i1.p1 TRINITY_DN6607_c0_g1~~TRINITY_DN6607_c0_g1_i1.p1  ORF type:complete len:545 (-),score=56.26 TRINITY_DN6607_c0_g1_i1:253-1887(-)